MHTFVDGELLTAATLNQALADLKKETLADALKTIADHENQIYVGGKWYQASGVRKVVSIKPFDTGSFSGADFTLTFPTPPAGYVYQVNQLSGDETWSIARTRYLEKDASVQVRVMCLDRKTAINEAYFSWHLVKNAY